MLQGMSKYNGYYWNVSNVPTKYEGERPYYVMLAGKRTALAKLLHSIEKNNSVHFKESYTEMGDAPVHYEVVKTMAHKTARLSCVKRTTSPLKEV